MQYKCLIYLIITLLLEYQDTNSLSHARGAWLPLNFYFETKFCFLSSAIAEGLVLREDALKILNTFWTVLFLSRNERSCLYCKEMLKISLYGKVNIPVISPSHIELNTAVFNNCLLLNCVCFDKRAVNAILLVLCFLSNIL